MMYEKCTVCYRNHQDGTGLPRPVKRKRNKQAFDSTSHELYMKQPVVSVPNSSTTASNGGRSTCQVRLLVKIRVSPTKLTSVTGKARSAPDLPQVEPTAVSTHGHGFHGHPTANKTVASRFDVSHPAPMLKSNEYGMFDAADVWQACLSMACKAPSSESGSNLPAARLPPEHLARGSVDHDKDTTSTSPMDAWTSIDWGAPVARKKRRTL